ncbi:MULTISPECIES: hypothetical protein [Tenacibaculum]|uniref:hypothetical protein n=1 Tax=Tenacibaculum TaxID=104267 RepID=UPI001F0B0981|nr:MULTISPECIES: hypothetical protein [Tenacibaculum]MCH3881544.1 hypothetical protein [Tenacibaculum aquimarinum]MDO6598861.1 hypothetical protein [Tenacibaculum sp. 1_MG-2023]
MKNFMKNILVLAIVFATLSSNATEKTSLNNEENGKTTLILKDVVQGEKLIIKDGFGVVLYNETLLKSGEYTKTFDLTTLPDGNYIFELDKKTKIKVYPFSVTSNTVKFDKESLKIIFKPKVEYKDNTIYVRALNSDMTPSKVELQYNVIDTTFETIYSENTSNTSLIAKEFKLLKNEKEEYKVIVTLNGRTFTTLINI